MGDSPATAAALEFFGAVYEMVFEFVMRFQRQFERMWNDLNSSMLKRIGIVIGAYLLIRPYYVKFIEWTHKKGEEREERKKKKEKKAKAKMSANTLRTGRPSEQPDSSGSDDSEDEDGDAVTTGAVLTEDQLDRKAHRRQRRIDRARETKEEMRKFEEQEWDDPDVEDLLLGRP